MRTIPHSIVSGLLALALTLTAAPTPALAVAPDDIVFSQAAHGDDPGDSEDLPVPEEDPAGAKIGAVCYPTLSDALAAAVSGDTITLLEDAVLDGSGLGNTKQGGTDPDAGSHHRRRRPHPDCHRHLL